MKRRLMRCLLVCFLLIMVSIFLSATRRPIISTIGHSVSSASPKVPKDVAKIIAFIYSAGTDIAPDSGLARCVQVNGNTKTGDFFRAIFVVKYKMNKDVPVFTELEVYYELLVRIDGTPNVGLMMILMTDTDLDGQPDKVVSERYLFDDKGQVLSSDKIDVSKEQASSFFKQLLNAFTQTFIRESSI